MGNVQADLNKLRRFSIISGLLFLLYAFLGIRIALEGTIPTVGFKVVLERGHFLVYVLVAVSLYTTFRYWFYVIHRQRTPRKERKFLKENGFLVTDCTKREKRNRGREIEFKTKSKNSRMQVLFRFNLKITS